LEEKEDPDKIDETKEIRMNGKEKTKDEFHFKKRHAIKIDPFMKLLDSVLVIRQ